MPGLFATYARDAKLENEGAPYVRTVHEDRTEGQREETYYLARMDESRNKAWAREMREFRRAQPPHWRSDDPLTEEQQADFLRRFCRTILRGWKNVHVDAPIPGKQGVLPHSEANARWLLSTLTELYDELAWAARQGKLFADEAFVGEANGSSTTSDGSSSSASEASSSSAAN